MKTSRHRQSSTSLMHPALGEVENESLLPETEIPRLCKMYCCPNEVAVRKQFLEERARRSKNITAKSSVTIPLLGSVNKIEPRRTTLEDSSELAEGTILMFVLYDQYNKLKEILFSNSAMPRILIQTVCLLIPRFETLSKITMKNCRLNQYSFYEIAKILDVSHITEISVNDCSLLNANFANILEKPSTLVHLSLCRCNINDSICEVIATKLAFSCPAERNLLLLDLTSNQITDVGAKYLAETLRSNRHLRYLNLSGNYITDEGATHILDKLIEFPLTSDEIISRKWEYIEYWKKKESLRDQLTREFENTEDATSRVSATSVFKRTPVSAKIKSTTKKSKKQTVQEKVDLLLDQILGPFIHPFSEDQIKIKDGYIYSTGNNVLSILNLSYNTLSYPILNKIASVKAYQETLKSSNLTNINIYGNLLPVLPEESICNLSKYKKTARFMGSRK